MSEQGERAEQEAKRRPRVSATTPVGTSNTTMPDGEERVGGEGLGVAEAGVEEEEGVDAPDERAPRAS